MRLWPATFNPPPPLPLPQPSSPPSPFPPPPRRRRQRRLPRSPSFDSPSATPVASRYAATSFQHYAIPPSRSPSPHAITASRPPASDEDLEVIACIFLRDEFSARTGTATFANFLVARWASGWKLGVALARDWVRRC